jgi:hypothetical protein
LATRKYSFSTNTGVAQPNIKKIKKIKLKINPNRRTTIRHNSRSNISPKKDLIFSVGTVKRNKKGLGERVKIT